MSDGPLQDLTLLMVGRTGNGKSSTGNSILGEKKFTPRGATSSVVIDIKKESVDRDGRTLTVVDGPGIGDTGSDAPEDGRPIIDLVEEAMKLVGYKFTALLLFLKYGVRFTKQEKDAVSQTRSIFGEDVLSKFGIIVMTHGDGFELDMDDDDTMTFEKWCKEQTGDVQDLFEECDFRCVLFNNKSKDDVQKKEQVDKLMSLVANVQSVQETPYTKIDFDKAVKGRTKILVTIKLPELEKKTEEFLDAVNKRLDEAAKGSSESGTLKEMERMMMDVQKHKEELNNEDQGTDSLTHLLLQVSVMETSIKSKMDLKRRVIENKGKQADLQRAEQERKRAEQERKRAEQERKRAEDERKRAGDERIPVPRKTEMKSPKPRNDFKLWNTLRKVFPIALFGGLYIERHYRPDLPIHILSIFVINPICMRAVSHVMPHSDHEEKDRRSQ